MSHELQSSQKGFSLLEILITIIVMSFGLLGMAALIIAGARGNNIAYYRSIASKQTEDIADRMRANQAGIIAGSYDALTDTIPTSSDCITNSCSATQIASFDHAQWNTANAGLLPNGVGTVTGNVTAGYVITLRWTEKEMGGEVDPNCPVGLATNTRCFVTRFVP